jgi:hypothetical protein
LCSSTLAHIELANLVQVLTVTTIIFMAYLTVMRNWLSSSHQSCWWGAFCKTVHFPAGALEVRLAVCHTLHPSSNPTRKSQVGLYQAVMGGLYCLKCNWPSTILGVLIVGSSIVVPSVTCRLLGFALQHYSWRLIGLIFCTKCVHLFGTLCSWNVERGAFELVRTE